MTFFIINTEAGVIFQIFCYFSKVSSWQELTEQK